MNTVKNALTDAGVQMYSGYYLARWNNSVEIPEIIMSSSFTSSGEPLKLDCQVGIYKHVCVHVYIYSSHFSL